MFLARQILPQPSTHSVQTLLANCFPTHTQTKDTKDHVWTSTQASKLLVCGGWYPVSPVTDRKRTSLTADNARNIIQEGRICHSKRKLPLINVCRWEQLQCCSKAIPTRGSTSRRESSGNLCGNYTVTISLHEKSSRKEIDVTCRACQITLKHFGLTKKKLPRTACDVQNWCRKKLNLKNAFLLKKKKK